MSQDPIVPGLPVGRANAQPKPESRSAADAASGPAFRALLDELTAKTRQLKQDGDNVSDAAELAGMVDRARSSIDDALSLSDQLLEAYRAHQSSVEDEEQAR